jgi:hypothetical protein
MRSGRAKKALRSAVSPRKTALQKTAAKSLLRACEI